MAKIVALTEMQERALAEYRQTWLAHGRSTAPADRPTAERVMREMYARLGRPAPYVCWCDGPAVGSLLRLTALGAGQGSVGANLWNTLWTTFSAGLRDSLRDNLHDSLDADLSNTVRESFQDYWIDLGANLSANLSASLIDYLRDVFRNELWTTIGVHLGGTLYGSLRDTLRDNVDADFNVRLQASTKWQFWGQHEGYWSAYYVWPHLALRPMHTDEQITQLTWWLDLARSVGWWEPFEHVVFVCERPLRQALDDRGRLHHPTEAAMICRDGWTIHAWHGTPVPKAWIEEPSSIAPERALTHPDIEQRRALAEILGWERILALLQPKWINRDADPQIGELVEVALPDAGPSRFLRVRCATGRWFALPVPYEMRTALQANAWTWGLAAADYHPQLRT